MHVQIFAAPILLAVQALQEPAVPDVLWRTLTSVHAHSTSAGHICLTLCYARQGAAQQRGDADRTTRAGPVTPSDVHEWREAAEAFRQSLVSSSNGAVVTCSVSGQWRKRSIVVGDEFVEEELCLNSAVPIVDDAGRAESAKECSHHGVGEASSSTVRSHILCTF